MKNRSTLVDDSLRSAVLKHKGLYFDRFSKQLASLDWRFGEGVLPTSPLPLVLPLSMRKRVAEISEAVFTAVCKVSAARVSSSDDSQIAKLLPVERDVLEFIRAEPVSREHQIIIRIDAILDTSTEKTQIVEVNCGDPSGMGWNDALVNIQKKDELLQSLLLGKEHHLDAFCPSLLDTLQETYRSYCIENKLPVNLKPFIVLVCGDTANISSDFLNIAEEFRKLGCDAELAAAESLELKTDGLYYQNRRVDIIYRDMIEDYFGPTKLPATERILEAVIRCRVCFVNPVSSATCEFKNLLTVLDLPDVKSNFSNAELQALTECLPSTKPMVDAKVDEYIQRQNQLVLKPNIGYGGSGVLIGKDYSSNEWREHVSNCLKGDYVVQDYISIPESLVAQFVDGNFSGFESRKINVSLWVHGGQFIGAYARSSKQSVVNISNSGGFLTVLWV